MQLETDLRRLPLLAKAAKVAKEVAASAMIEKLMILVVARGILLLRLASTVEASTMLMLNALTSLLVLVVLVLLLAALQ